MGRPIRNIEDTRRLQEDLNRLQDWSEKWKMQFNVNKCTIMSIGKENFHVEYSLSKNTLGKTCSARDLGVQISSDLHPRQQCILAGNRSNKILGFIGRCVTNRTPDVILRLYLALVRSHLDYAMLFWCPVL